MLKQRERIRSALQSVPADVSISLRDGCAFVSDQRHDNGVRNASIFEQADRGVPQRVEAQFEYLAFACTSYATRVVRPWLAEAGGSENLGELPGEGIPTRPPCAWMISQARGWTGERGLSTVGKESRCSRSVSANGITSFLPVLRVVRRISLRDRSTCARSGRRCRRGVGLCRART